MDIAVIGAGIIGLTTGKSLLKRGHKVTFIARDFDSNVKNNIIDRIDSINPTASASPVAASFWLPFGLDSVDKDQVVQIVTTLFYWHSITASYKTAIFKGYAYVLEHAIKGLQASQKIRDAFNCRTK
jgi:glycine/D-amino acid oxidase-like deaminating enzyme